MLRYDDGTPASTPQMAHDVATFLDFLDNHNYPDIRLTVYMAVFTIATWLLVVWPFAKMHEITHHSCKK